jgi:membrane protein
MRIPMKSAGWRVLKQSVMAYIEDDALSRGAAIAYYTVTSLAPVLIIVIGIAGLVFGQDAARGAIVAQVRELIGQQSAELLQTMVQSASDWSSGVVANVVGFTTLLVTASGVFTEMQSALNAMWRASPQGTPISRLVRARIVGLGLVGALGFVLLASLIVSTALSALANVVDELLPLGALLVEGVNFVISFAVLSVVFAAIYKVLPDRRLTWMDVAIGGAATSLLFMIGKTLIGLYLGRSSMASSYGAAGGLLLLLLWVYYSSQIFLLGAEFTKAYASVCGSFRGTDVAASVPATTT